MDENTTVINTNTISKPAKHVIQSEIAGFPVISTVYGKADVLTALIEKLKAIGATPPTRSTTPAAASAPAEPAGPPVCPIHKTKMKQGRKGWYCSKKTADGEYCDQTG